MKPIYLFLTILCGFAGFTSSAQTGSSTTSTIDSLAGFDETEWTSFYYQHHSSPQGLPEFIAAHKRSYIHQVFYHPHARPGDPANPTIQQACTNIDFENGDLSGWTRTTGFNPIFNALGCCLNAGGAQAIMNGTGLDPCGGFPVVAPGGNFSLRLGDNNVNGIADRMEQSFSVTLANANFTYRYAVVFEDPGHALIDQPSFQIEMLDATGNPIPCTFYNVSAGQGIPGFQNAACAGVIYKPWTDVSVDLTGFIGQDVTIRFTTYDCSLGGHYAYAYIDGSCLGFSMSQSGLLCQGSTVQVLAPVGFSAYNWTGPNNTTYTGQAITTGAPGIYTVNLTTMTGCPGPTLTYTLAAFPKPTADFTILQANACSQQVSVSDNSSLASGLMTAYNWDLGNGNTGSGTSANLNLPVGTHPIQLICTSDMGCKDTVVKPVTVSPLPVVNFSAPGVCLGNPSAFTNSTSVASGFIAHYDWQFGDGTSAIVPQPTHGYALPGSYNVTLTAVSDKNCSSSLVQAVDAWPLPHVVFSAANVCDGVSMNFNNATSIALGSISNYLWDFTSDGMPDGTTQNASNTFAGAGTYQVKLSAISDHNCMQSTTVPVTVYPNPVASFSTANVCVGTVMSFNDLSQIPSGSIVSYNWDLGDYTADPSQNPQHLYGTYGTYMVNLTVTSDHQCTHSVSGPGTVYPRPNVSFLSTTACLNQPTQFNNQSGIVAGSITAWRWDFDNNGTVDDVTQNPSYLYPSAGTQQSRLEAVSNNNCVNQTISPVIVHYNPVADFTAPSTCMPDVTPFTNSSTSTDGAITSQAWDFTGDNLPDNISVNPTYSYAQLGAHAVKLEVQTQYGCMGTIMKAVYVNPKPSVQFAAQNTMGCPRLCVNFTNSSSIGSGQIASYQWWFGDSPDPENSTNPTHCYDVGNYNVTLKAWSDSGCFNSQTAPALVNVYPRPLADFAVDPSEIDITTPLINVDNKAQGASSVIYYFNDGTVKTTPNFSHSFNTDVAKTVLIMQVATNAYGCRDSLVKQVVIRPAYTLYVPNAFTPNQDGINDGFRAVGIGISSFRMWIFDRWGNVIFESNDINKAWDGSVNGKGDYDRAKQDVYVWKAEVTDVLMQKHDLIGNVSVVK